MRKKNLVTLLASIFIFVFIWIGLNIYHNSVSSTITGSVNAQLSPISPSFDTKTIDKLKKRQNVTPIFESSIFANPSPPSPDISQTISSGSAEQATSGGSLSE